MVRSQHGRFNTLPHTPAYHAVVGGSGAESNALPTTPGA